MHLHLTVFFFCCFCPSSDGFRNQELEGKSRELEDLFTSRENEQVVDVIMILDQVKESEARQKNVLDLKMEVDIFMQGMRNVSTYVNRLAKVINIYSYFYSCNAT